MFHERIEDLSFAVKEQILKSLGLSFSQERLEDLVKVTTENGLEGVLFKKGEEFIHWLKVMLECWLCWNRSYLDTLCLVFMRVRALKSEIFIFFPRSLGLLALHLKISRAVLSLRATFFGVVTLEVFKVAFIFNFNIDIVYIFDDCFLLGTFLRLTGLNNK